MFVLFPIETHFLANMTVFMPISTLSPIEITPPTSTHLGKKLHSYQVSLALRNTSPFVFGILLHSVCVAT